MVLRFSEGVFVFTQYDNYKITILKICDNTPFNQKICDHFLGDVAISNDGCAVLLYHKISEQTEDITTHLQHQLWEFTPESGWELHLDGTIGRKFRKIGLKCLSLAGTQNCRRSLWSDWTLQYYLYFL